MPGDERPVPSRLAARASGGPLRGMGAGFPENQRRGGVQNPEAAAALAGMSQADAALAAREVEAREEARRAKLAEIAEAVSDGWKPEGYEHLTSQLDTLSASKIEALHSLLLKANEEKIDEETQAELAENLHGSIAIGPEDPLYNPMTDVRRRKAIESKLTPLDFDSMVFMGFVEQKIETRPGFVVTMRSVYTQHGLWIEAYMSTLPDTTVQNFRHTASMLNLACAVDRINDKPIGSDISKLTKETQREDFIAAVKTRLEFLGRLPGELTDDLIVQLTWFSGRVRKLISGDLLDKVGNS